MNQPIINLPVVDDSTAQLFSQLEFEQLEHQEDFSLFTDGTAIFRLDKASKFGKGLLLHTPEKVGEHALDAAEVSIHWVEDTIFTNTADGQLRSICGQFYEISVGVENEAFKTTIQFWQTQGFKIIENDPDIHTYVTLQWQDFKLSVYKKVHCPHLFNSPALTYFERDMQSRIKQLKAKGIAFAQELKNKEGQIDSAVIETVEGYHLFLFAY